MTTGRLCLSAIRIAAAALLAPIAAAASAQETGTRIDSYRGAVGTIESEGARTARRVMVTFGRCVARNRGRTAESVLALPLHSSEQHERARQSIGGEDGCLGVGDRELRFSPSLLVGAMAEHFIVTRYRNVDLGAVAALTDEQQTEIGLDARTAYEAFAICVVRRDPAAVRTLVDSRPAGNEEGEALGRVLPHLGPCLSAGSDYTFSKGSLRSLLAAGLYRVLSVMGGA